MTNTQQRTEYRRGHKKTSRWSFAPSLGKKKVRIESPEETADIDARIDAVVASDRITVRRQPPPPSATNGWTGGVGTRSAPKVPGRPPAKVRP